MAICTIVNDKGLHVRAAAEIVKLCQKFDAQATITHNGISSPTNSIIKLITLAATKGSDVSVKTDGPQARSLLNALETLIARGFYE